MTRFRSILSPKFVSSIGQSLHFAFQKAVMASAGGREIAHDDDPWRISAFISALMELFLSVLLLLGAAIAFITSQLVNFFGLEPPCTYIGCSHTRFPSSTREHQLDHARQDFLYELCPDCRTSWGYMKRCNKKFLLTKDDTDMSLLLEGDDISSNDSITSTSGVDVPHLDYVSSDPCSARSSSSSSGIRNGKKPMKQKCVKPRASNFADDGSQFINDDSSSISSAEDYCEELSRTSCKVPGSLPEKVLQEEMLKDDEASVHNLNGVSNDHNDEHHYMLLEDEDEDEEVYQDPFLDSFEAISDSDQAHGYMALEDDDDILEAGESHSEIAQPLLPCVSESISEAERPFPASPVVNKVSIIDINDGSHGPLNIEPAEGSDHYDCVEHGKGPICANTFEGEHHYILLEGDDEETSHAFFLNDLHSESVQPLLNDVSDDGLELPNSHKRVLNVVDLFDNHRSSGIRRATNDMAQHEPTQSSVQTTRFKEEQHQYTLLGDDDEDFSEAPDLEDMPCDCAQPSLQIADEGQLDGQRLSINSEGAEPVANVGDSYKPEIERSAEGSACGKSPQTSRESTHVKAFMKPHEMQDTESLFQGFAADHIDASSPQGSQGSNDSVVKDHMEIKNYLEMDHLNAPPRGLTIFQKSKEKETQVPLIDIESSSTVLFDLVEAEKVQELKYSGSGSQIVLTEEAIVFGMVDIEVHKQGSSSSQEHSVQEVLTGLCISDLESRNFAPVHDVHLCQMEGQLEEFESSPVAGFMNNDGNMVAVAAEGCSVEFESANEIDDTGNVRSTANSSFAALFEELVAQPDISFESFDKERPRKAAENLHAEPANVSRNETVLKVTSQVAEQDKEEMQVEEDQEEGLDALRETLLAERKLLAALEAELENERNAAAIATSEAMAMISRLQEEKSAMQLEVAQLQRMAEEKAEYDEQAMELLKEILFKRETEKHALEKEVEHYRQRLTAEKGENISMQSSAPLLLLSRTDEDKDPFSPKRQNDNPRNLPSLDEFFKSEDPFSPNNGHIVAQEQQTARSSQSAKPPELSISEGLYANDQVDPCFAEEKGAYASPFSRRLGELHHTHQELRGTSRSIFSTNDEETQFILERLWVLEEELRELRGIDGLEAQKKSLDGQNLGSSSTCRKRFGDTVDAFNDREADGQACENGVGAYLPLHDVYEVQSAPIQQGQDIKQGSVLSEYSEILEELRSSPRDIKHEDLAPTMHCHSTQVITHPGRPIPINETQCDSTIIASQVETYADNAHAHFLKVTEGDLVSTDVIQQLAVRLQVLETDRELLREILESFRHRDAELKLLQEVAQQLRELRMVGFSSISAGGVLQSPMSATFGKSCAHAFKKRRYCSEPGQADILLLHQRSI